MKQSVQVMQQQNQQNAPSMPDPTRYSAALKLHQRVAGITAGFSSSYHSANAAAPRAVSNPPNSIQEMQTKTQMFGSSRVPPGLSTGKAPLMLKPGSVSASSQGNTASAFASANSITNSITRACPPGPSSSHVEQLMTRVQELEGQLLQAKIKELKTEISEYSSRQSLMKLFMSGAGRP